MSLCYNFYNRKCQFFMIILHYNKIKYKNVAKIKHVMLKNQSLHIISEIFFKISSIYDLKYWLIGS